jgi:transposase InsO family protein
VGRSETAVKVEAEPRDAAAKPTRQRLSVLELVVELGSVADVYRAGASNFDNLKSRFQTQGFAGLKDLPALQRSHPRTTPAEVQDRICALALEHPAYSCNRIEALLGLEGWPVSAITVQQILNEHDLGTRYDRWLTLERTTIQRATELTGEQVVFLEKLNPCFRERHVESWAPGELLSADTFFVGFLKDVGKVYLHAVVDTCGSHAFGFLHASKPPEAAVAVLHNDVLPFYRELVLPVQALLTDNGCEFCGPDAHPYKLYLELNGIEHRRTKVRSTRTNDFVERFRGTVFDEFFRGRLRESSYDTVEALQSDLDAWLVRYNIARPHL